MYLPRSKGWKPRAKTLKYSWFLKSYSKRFSPSLSADSFFPRFKEVPLAVEPRVRRREETLVVAVANIRTKSPPPTPTPPLTRTHTAFPFRPWSFFIFYSYYYYFLFPPSFERSLQSSHWLTVLLLFRRRLLSPLCLNLPSSFPPSPLSFIEFSFFLPAISFP